MTKPKFDLSNPGGQPKGAFDEPESDHGWLEDLRMTALGFGLPIGLLLCAAGFVLGLLKYFGKL